MRSILTYVVTGALVLCTPAFTDSAAAHGGAYRGPAGEIPPESRDPSDPPPPPEDRGPTTPPGEPGGGGPTTPGDSTGGGTTTPGDGPTRGAGPTNGPSSGPGGGLGGAKTPRKAGGSRGPGFEDWTFWWNYNKDDLLQLRARLGAGGASTGTAIHGLGGRGAEESSVIPAAEAAVWNEIVPPLREMLADDTLNFDIRSAAALALAKIGDRSIAPTLHRLARNDKGTDAHRIVEESAALALGLLQDDSDENVGVLIELLEDRDRNASYVRPFAAISLGLLAGERHTEPARESLLAVLAGKETKPDVKPASLLALGLLGDSATAADLVHMVNERRVDVAALHDVRRADELSDVEVSFAIQALGKIGYPGDDGEVVALVEGFLTSRKKVDVHIRRASAIALGQLAPATDAAEQKRIARVLQRTAEKGKDASERTFAMIALGRMAAERGVSDDARDDITRGLGQLLVDGRPKGLVQPFAGLSLGLVGQGRPSGAEEAIRKPLRERFASTERGDPRARGAYAVASGLTGDALAVEQLVEVLADRGADKRLRGYCAIGLGLIGEDASRDAILDVLADPSDRDLRVQTAIAAGLSQDGRAVEKLVAILDSGEESQYVLGSVALALGKIGDERAVAPLLAIAADTDDRYPDITRALATVALGQIGDRAEVPVLSRVARDINFRAIGGVPALNELLTIL